LFAGSKRDYKSGYSSCSAHDEDPEKEILYNSNVLEKRIDGLVISTAFQDGIHPFFPLKGIPWSPR